MLEFRLLGKFDLRLDSAPIVIPSRAAQSLLAYLLLNSATLHRREQLAGLLWPDVSDKIARRNLRQELWRLRKLIAPANLHADDIAVTFQMQSDDWLDTTVLAKASAEDSTTDELIAAVALYHGDLLPGFYDEWVIPERERLRAIFERKMQRLLERLIGEQDWSDALEWGERWIGLGQSPESAYRARMTAYAAMGDMSKAAAEYERCVAALSTDLGVEPSEQTRALFQRLRTGAQSINRTSAALAPDLPAATQPLLDTDAPAPGEQPFKGLQYFDEKDADWFFGREDLVAKLVNRLRATSLLVVIGASGSGKSSLVRAGLVAALKREGSWQTHVITPTAHPLEALAISLTREVESAAVTTALADDLAHDARSLRVYCQKQLPAGYHTLIVLDQFEELFTLCRDEAECKALIDNLLAATVPASDQSIFLILALRADFYAHCAQYANLRDALEKNQAYIGQMSAAELRCAIEEPAKRGDWSLEPGLVDLFLRDVGDEPGALPLLSHALLETWLRRRGRLLTFAGYTASDGVHGAIAKTAENVYQKLGPAEQGIARNIFLRLTEPGEGTQDTCRRVNFNELVPPSSDMPTLLAVLNTLADARLITLGQVSVEVAHEALIREWSRLREWLNQDREGRQLHRHLTEAAQEWERLGHDPGSLYRGARLGQALEWAESKPIEMNRQEWLFLDASKKQTAQEEAEREAQRQRELRAAQKLAEAERHRAEAQTASNRKLRQRAVFLAGTLLVALVLAIVATWFAQQSNQNEQAAIAQKSIAEDERRIAFVRELSFAAANNLEIDPERSILLALQAVSASTAGGKPVLQEAEEALHRAVMSSRVQLTLRGHKNSVYGVAFSPDGRRIATASLDNTAKVWDAATGQELLTLSGHTERIFGITYSLDGKRLATASNDERAKVWDATTGKELVTLSAHSGPVYGVAFSLDGTRVATSIGLPGTDTVDHTAQVWDAATGNLLLTLMGHANGVNSVAFSPDGRRLATGSSDRTAKIWDAATGKELLTLIGHTDYIAYVAFSPDGKRLATGSNDRTAKVWDAATGQLLMTLFGHDAVVNSVAFDPAGTRLVTASQDGIAKIWDAATGQLLMTLAGHGSGLRQAVFSHDGTRVATSSDDNTAKVWDVSPTGSREWFTLANRNGRVRSVAYSADGQRIATAGTDKTARVWDALTGRDLLTLSGHTDELRDVAFSPDGSRLVTTSNDQTARVWDISTALNTGATTGKEILTIPTQSYRYVRALRVAISPDGQRIAAPGPGIVQTTSGEGVLKIWDIKSGKESLTLSGHRGAVYGVAFSPDGKRIATASTDRTAKVWDAETGKELLTLAGHTAAVWDENFSPDGRRIATASSDGTAKVWDATSGQVLLTLSGHIGAVRNSVFSPDGTRLATSGDDGTTKLWDLSLGSGRSEQPLTLHGHSGIVNRAVFSPDGKRVVTAGDDGTVRVYALPLEDIVAIAKSRVTRALTTDECQKFLHVEKCPP